MIADFPPQLEWKKIASSNALKLFPERCFQSFRVNHRIFNQKFIVLSNPKSIKDICGYSADKYRLSNLQKRMLKPALGNGLTIAEGKSWKTQRRVGLADVARSRTFQINTAETIIDNWFTRLMSENTKSFELELSGLVLDLLGFFLFQNDGNVANDEILESISQHRVAIERIELVDLLGISPLLHTKRKREAKRHISEMDRLIVSTARDKLNQLDGPMAHHSMSDKELRDYIVSMLSGYEATAATLLWSLSMIGAKPELLDIFAHDPLPSIQDLAAKNCYKTSSLRVFSEILRLYPPLPFIFRVANIDVETPDGPIPSGILTLFTDTLLIGHSLKFLILIVFQVERPQHSCRLVLVKDAVLVKY